MGMTDCRVSKTRSDVGHYGDSLRGRADHNDRVAESGPRLLFVIPTSRLINTSYKSDELLEMEEVASQY